MREETNIERLTDGEKRVADLLNSLPRVAAPGDFDMRVRARIAQGRPEDRRSWIPRFAGVAVPAALAVAIGGYFAFAPSAPQAPVPVAEAVPVERPVENAPIVASSEPAPAATGTQTVAQREVTRPTVSEPEKKDDKKVALAPKPTVEGGSYEQARKESKVITAPNHRQNVLARARVRTSGDTVTFAPASSGLKVGDVIVGVNGTTVSVRRDGKITNVVIR